MGRPFSFETAILVADRVFGRSRRSAVRLKASDAEKTLRPDVSVSYIVLVSRYMRVP